VMRRRLGASVMRCKHLVAAVVLEKANNSREGGLKNMTMVEVV
jgi:hypothetical protein